MNVVEHRPPLKRIDTSPVRAAEITEPPECPYTRAARINRERNIWDAVTATAHASQQTDKGQGSQGHDRPEPTF